MTRYKLHLVMQANTRTLSDKITDTGVALPSTAMSVISTGVRNGDTKYMAQHFLMGVRKGNTISASEALTGIMPTYEDFA